jgi:hypothetical protein
MIKWKENGMSNYLIHTVSVYNLDLELLSFREFISKEKADEYAKNLRSQHFKHVGKIGVKTKEVNHA